MQFGVRVRGLAAVSVAVAASGWYASNSGALFSPLSGLLGQARGTSGMTEGGAAGEASSHGPGSATSWPVKVWLGRVGKVAELPPRNEILQNSLPLLEIYWASWCHPCREEAASLNETLREYSGKLLPVVIAFEDDDAALTGNISSGIAASPQHRDALKLPNTYIGIAGSRDLKRLAPNGIPSMRLLVPQGENSAPQEFHAVTAGWSNGELAGFIENALRGAPPIPDSGVSILKTLKQRWEQDETETLRSHQNKQDVAHANEIKLRAARGLKLAQSKHATLAQDDVDYLLNEAKNTLNFESSKTALESLSQSLGEQCLSVSQTQQLALEISPLLLGARAGNSASKELNLRLYPYLAQVLTLASNYGPLPESALAQIREALPSVAQTLAQTLHSDKRAVYAIATLREVSEDLHDLDETPFAAVFRPIRQELIANHLSEASALYQRRFNELRYKFDAAASGPASAQGAALISEITALPFGQLSPEDLLKRRRALQLLNLVADREIEASDRSPFIAKVLTPLLREFTQVGGINDAAYDAALLSPIDACFEALGPEGLQLIPKDALGPLSEALDRVWRGTNPSAALIAGYLRVDLGPITTSSKAAVGPAPSNLPDEQPGTK